MSAGRLLIDTNAAIARIKGDPLVTAVLDAVIEVRISFVTVGELYYGAYRSSRVAFNLRKLEAFVATVPILYVDQEASRFYGETKQKLSRKGRPIPEDDLWIASLALRHGLPVLTRDAHFNEVDGLTVISW